MKKVVMNKNFVSKYTYAATQSMFKYKNDLVNTPSLLVYALCGSGSNNREFLFAPYYTDVVNSKVISSNGVNLCQVNVEPALYPIQKSSIVLCDSTFISLIDKLNEDSVQEFLSTENVDINALLNTLTNTDTRGRKSAMDYLENNSIITVEERTVIDNSFRGLTVSGKINYSNLVISNDENSISYDYQRPVEFDSKYISNNEEMYLLYISYNTDCFSGLGYGADRNISNNPFEYADRAQPKVITSFFSDTKQDIKYVIPYIALKITDTNGDGDIKYDHIDKISHLDNIKFSINLPKEIILSY